uniref:CapA family protein n=1 Tax=Eiseniibacteriota bacterium TaxID=2212470 RepID=A0A832MIY6_UNCEI
MKRRTFLRRAAALGGGLALARAALARQGVGAPAPETAYDTLRVAPREGAPTDSAAARVEPAVTLAAGGDVVLGYNLQDHVDRELAAGVPREELFARYFAGVRHLTAAADLAVVNLECPFTERGVRLEKNFNFRARPELVEILKLGGVDVVSLANNHTMDWGVEGLEDTLATLNAAGIGRFGAGRDLAAARAPLVMERNGLRIGFLGYYFQSRRNMIEPEAMYARADRPGVAGCYVDLACVKRMVREDVEALVPRVDAVIPFFHWGKEGSYVAQPYQRELAHLCVDLGCRAVLGAHPHRVQGIEVRRGAPIVHSLANLVYGGIKDPQDPLSFVARLRVTRSAVDCEVVPIRITRWPEAPFQPFPLDGALRELALARMAELSRALGATTPQLAQVATE